MAYVIETKGKPNGPCPWWADYAFKWGPAAVIAVVCMIFLTGSFGPVGQTLAGIKEIKTDIEEHRAIETVVIWEIRKICRNTARSAEDRGNCDRDK